jgi:hypothetical protein
MCDFYLELVFGMVLFCVTDGSHICVLRRKILEPSQGELRYRGVEDRLQLRGRCIEWENLKVGFAQAMAYERFLNSG